MRAKTKGKHEMGKRFAIVIGVAAVGVMALGAQTVAQTAAQPPAVVKYDTTLVIPTKPSARAVARSPAIRHIPSRMDTPVLRALPIGTAGWSQTARSA